MAAQDLISRRQLTLIVEALEYKAHGEAGHSQMPDLIEQEDTEEWILAQDLRRIYNMPCVLTR